jgi:DNA-binding transcriptional regulator YbjK
MSRYETVMKRPGVRIISQDRSALRRTAIAEAAARVIADHGLAGITHRRVAAEAGVSLAATTYYYASKADIVADASRLLLEEQVDRLQDFARAVPSPEIPDFRALAVRLIANMRANRLRESLACCEIVLGAARQPELRDLAREWFAGVQHLWTESGPALGLGDSPHAVRSALDIVAGLTFMTMALGVSDRQVVDVLGEGQDPELLWQPAPAMMEDQAPSDVLPLRAQDTRERILAATIDLLAAEGPDGVTFRSVAARAGLTAAAPTYHFPRIEQLLSAAHGTLVGQVMSRNRDNIALGDYAATDGESLADLAATLLIREATENGPVNIALYTLWLEASRRPDLRPAVWTLLVDQLHAWDGLVERIKGRRIPRAALTLQALFAGKLVRVLATGTTTPDLARTRAEFMLDISAVLAGRHWLVAS